MIEELAEMDATPEEKAFEAFIGILQADPALSRVVKTWATWDGDPADAEPPASDATPWIRITPDGGAPDWLFQNGWAAVLNAPMRIKVELCIADISAAARMRFWHLVRAAALAPDPAQRQANKAVLEVVGVNNVANTKGGYGIDQATDQGLVISIAGFELSLQVDA